MKTNPIVKLNNVRASFLNALWSPKQDTNEDGSPKTGKPKYSATFLLDKKVNAKDIVALNAAIAEVKKDPKLVATKRQVKSWFRDGAEKDHLEGYGPAIMFLCARSTTKPGVVDQALNDITEDSGKLFAGCYVNARVQVYPFIHPKSGPMVCFALMNVQKFRDGEPFGEGPRDSTEGFDQVEQMEEQVV